jgi:peroxiredoxin Q/BCP
VDPGSKVASLYRASGIIVKRTVYLIGMEGAVRIAGRGKPAPEDVFGHADIQDQTSDKS